MLSAFLIWLGKLSIAVAAGLLFLAVVLCAIAPTDDRG